MTTDNLLVAQIVLIVILLLKEYLFSFIKEKGKNLATQQDIKEITNKIEEAKIFYNTKLETVKTSLQISAYEQNKIIELSLNSLLVFYETSLVLIKDNLTRNFGDMAGTNIGETLFKFENETEDLFTKQNILYHKLLVFMGTELEVISKAVKLGETSSAMRKIFKNHIGNIKLALHQESRAIKSTEQVYQYAVAQTTKYTKAYYDEAKPILIDLHKKLEEFIQVMISYLKRKKLVE